MKTKKWIKEFLERVWIFCGFGGDYVIQVDMKEPEEKK